MTGAAPDAPRRLTDRLGFRLAALLSLALLPVGLIAVSQSAYLMREARARSEAAILGATLRAALPQLRDVFAGAGLSLGQTSVGTQGGQGDHQQARSQRGASGSNAIADIAAGGVPGASAAQVLRWQQGLVNTYV